jgi:hypothetical protein
VTRTVPRAVLVAGGAGALLVVVGLVALLWRLSPLAPTEFGWFAYSVQGGDDDPVLYVVAPRDLWGAAAAALGLATVAAVTGYLMGARRTAAGGPPTAE